MSLILISTAQSSESLSVDTQPDHPVVLLSFHRPLVILIFCPSAQYVATCACILLSRVSFAGDEGSVLEKQLFPFLREEQQFNSFIHRSWIKSPPEQSAHLSDIHRKRITAFVGNGKFGLGLDGDSAFYIRGRRGLVCQVQVLQNMSDLIVRT